MRKLIVTGLGLFLAAACFAEAPARRSAPARQQWEYQALTREKVTELGKKDFAAGLNKLGEDGWELVTVTPAQEATPAFGPHPAEYYFKRPKGQATREEPRRVEAAPKAADTQLTVLRLKFTPARELVNTLQPLFEDDKSGLVIASDVRTNSLLLRGPQKQIEQVHSLVRELDVPDAEDGGARKKGTP